MLVITLRVGERAVVYGPDGRLIGHVSLSMVKSMERARVGFDFPREIKVLREELVKRDGNCAEEFA